jgi:hypothetical protein
MIQQLEVGCIIELITQKVKNLAKCHCEGAKLRLSLLIALLDLGNDNRSFKIEEAAIPFQNWVAYADFLDPEIIIGPESVFPGFDPDNLRTRSRQIMRCRVFKKTPEPQETILKMAYELRHGLPIIARAIEGLPISITSNVPPSKLKEFTKFIAAHPRYRKLSHLLLPIFLSNRHMTELARTLLKPNSIPQAKLLFRKSQVSWNYLLLLRLMIITSDCSEQLPSSLSSFDSYIREPKAIGSRLVLESMLGALERMIPASELLPTRVWTEITIQSHSGIMSSAKRYWRVRLGQRLSHDQCLVRMTRRLPHAPSHRIDQPETHQPRKYLTIRTNQLFR